MEVQTRENTHENPEHAPARGDRDAVGDLLSEWRAQHTAFGVLLVVYAFLMSLTPLIARYSDETSQMICASLQAIVDWRIWVLVVTALCLVAILIIALKRRH